MDGSRVTIADIARELGVSTATVSNVIHGKTGRVSPETFARIQQALEERQYIPSMAGILLAQNDSRIIGAVVNNHKKYEGHLLEDGFISASLNALSMEADRAGFFLMIKVASGLEEIPRFASMWNMAGLVIMGFCQQDYQSLRNRMRVPFVAYDSFCTGGQGLVGLDVDHFDGGRQTGALYRRLGHRNVLCVSDNDVDMDHQRFLGLRSVYPQAELLIIPAEKKARREFYLERLPYLLSFTGVFAVSDYYAADLILLLQSQGIPVPGKISVTGFDNSMLARSVYPSLTTISQDPAQRASLALELLRRLHRGEPVEPSYTLGVSLVERESAGPPEAGCRA